jgi:hypothetical protein
MTGKLSRRAFLRQVGLYSVGFVAVNERGTKEPDAYGKQFPVSRIVFESLACMLQLKQMKDDEKIDRTAILNQTCEPPPT